MLLFALAGSVGAQFDWLPGAGINPDSKFYFLDKWGESVGMFFAFSAEKKSEKSLKYAEEKLAEAEEMAEAGKNEAYEKALQNYEKHMNQNQERMREMEQKGEKMAQISEKVANATSKHFEVLRGVSEKVPEQAKGALNKALEASGKGHKQALEVLAKESPQKAMNVISTRAKKNIDQVKEKINQGKAKEAQKELEKYEEYLKFSNGFVTQMGNKMEQAVKGMKQKAQEEIRKEAKEQQQELQQMMNQTSEQVRNRIRETLQINQAVQNQNRQQVRNSDQEGTNGSVCAQVITPAENPNTGECKNFPTPCDVPSGWSKVDQCEDSGSVDSSGSGNSSGQQGPGAENLQSR